MREPQQADAAHARRNASHSAHRCSPRTLSCAAVRTRPSTLNTRAPSGVRLAATSRSSRPPPLLLASCTRTSHSCNAAWGKGFGGGQGVGWMCSLHERAWHASDVQTAGTHSAMPPPCAACPRMHACPQLRTCESLSVETHSLSSLTLRAVAGAPSAKQTASRSALLPQPLGPRMQVRPCASRLKTEGAAPPKLLNARTLTLWLYVRARRGRYCCFGTITAAGSRFIKRGSTRQQDAPHTRTHTTHRPANASGAGPRRQAPLPRQLLLSAAATVSWVMSVYLRPRMVLRHRCEDGRTAI
jgi:hypothetical protein